MKGLTSSIRKLIPQAPLWSNHIQRPAKTRIIPPTTIAEAPGVVYFCACINRMMGGDIFQRMESLCRKAGIDMITTSETLQSCCGQIFSSKGYADAYKHMANQTVEQLWNATRQGALPVVLDVSSCTQTLLHSRPYLTQENQQRFDNIQLLDIVDFAADWLLPRLHISRPKEKVVFHPVCSVQKMGTLPKLQAIGRACAKQADIPVFAACCGMAGDRGMYYPGLTSAATKRESDEVKQQTYEGYYSTSTTCEMALSESVGAEYTGILTLLDESSD